MFYVYCRRGSDSARALSNTLKGIRLRKFDGMNFIRRNKVVKFKKGDVLVAWGDSLPDVELEGVKILNAVDVPDKYKVAMKLAENGVPTVQVFKPTRAEHTQPRYLKQMKDGGYIARRFNHVGGNDLLTETIIPDYWSQKIELTEEYRIHSFNGKSIRAGKKILREGYSLSDTDVAASDGSLKRASDWIRSYEGGWRICYDAFESRKAMREVAHKAVAALGLTFGAVDVAKTKDNRYIVLEVNRAPGLEGNSIEKYAEVIKEWANENAGVQGGSAEVGEPVRLEGEPALTVVEPELRIEPAAVNEHPVVGNQPNIAVPFPYAWINNLAPVQPEQPAPARPNGALANEFAYQLFINNRNGEERIYQRRVDAPVAQAANGERAAANAVPPLAAPGPRIHARIPPRRLDAEAVQRFADDIRRANLAAANRALNNPPRTRE